MTAAVVTQSPLTPSIAYSVVEFDATKAEAWLQYNTNNRTVTRAAVDRYKRDMAAGSWKFAADPIRVDKTGRIIDGQHRLMALSELHESIKVPFLVVTGLEPGTQMVMDQGVKRSTGQQLSILGIKYSNNVAAAAKLYIIWTQGLLFKDKYGEQILTTPQIQEWVTEHMDFVEFQNEMHALVTKIDASPAVTTAALWGFSQVDPVAARTFADLLESGAGLGADSPILALDKRLRKIRRDKVKVPNRDLLAFFILAWNAWREGKSVVKFQRPRGGSWTEASFPVVK